MTAASLTPLLFLLTAFAWAKLLVLGYAAFSGPRIGALTERTFIALVIAFIGTISSLLVINTDQGRPYFDAPTASLMFRSGMLVLLAVPAIWLVLYSVGRLGGSGKG